MEKVQKGIKSHQLTANWSSVKCPDSGPRAHHASIQYKHYLITFGGKAGSRALNDIICFDMIKLQWKQVYPSGANPKVLYGHTLCLNEDQIIVFGGKESYTSLLTRISRITINPETLSMAWENIQPSDGVHGPARSHHTAHIYKKAMYIIGGDEGTFMRLAIIPRRNNSAERNNTFKTIPFFCLETLTWRQCIATGEIPDNREEHCSILYENKIYVYGGILNDTSALLNDFYTLDLVTKTWKCINVLGPTPGPRTGATAQESSGKIIIFGGRVKDEEEEEDEEDYSNDIFMFETKSNAWVELKAIGEVPTESQHPTSALFENKLFVWGGEGYSGTISGINSIALDEVINDKQIVNVVKAAKVNPALKKLYTEKLYTDVTFQVEGQEFSAHRNILAGSCKYFHNMFSSGMQESKATKIDVLDVKAPTFKALLEFIYCEQTEVDQALVLELIHLSDKYCFPELKTGCEVSLAASLNEENFVELAKLSEQLETSILKEAILKFMAENTQKILQRKDLGSLPKPILVQVMSKLNKKSQ